MRYLEDERMLLLPADTGLAEELAAYCLRNREFLKEFEPLREEMFYTAQHQKQLLEEDIKHWNEKTGFRFYIKRKEDPTAIIGSIGINNVIWGSLLFRYVRRKIRQRLHQSGLYHRCPGSCHRLCLWRTGSPPPGGQCDAEK